MQPGISGFLFGMSGLPGVSGLIPGVSGFHNIFAPKTEILVTTKLTHENRNSSKP